MGAGRQVWSIRTVCILLLTIPAARLLILLSGLAKFPLPAAGSEPVLVMEDGGAGMILSETFGTSLMGI